MAAFTEVQTYGWVMNIAVAAVMSGIFLFFWRHTNEKRALLLCFIPVCLVAVYLMSERFETRLDANGIHYRMWPIQQKERNIGWQEISSLRIDYVFYKSKAHLHYDIYTIMDKYALYVHLPGGKVVELGTKKPDEINKLLAARRRGSIY